MVIIKIYCVGLGKEQFEKHLSKTLLKHWQKGDIQLMKLCDLDENRCHFFSTYFKSYNLILKKENISTNFDTLISEVSMLEAEEKKRSIIVISTPAKTHYELCRKALTAGVNVYVDKPFVMNYAQGEELVKIAEEKERLIVVGAQRKFEPIFQRILVEVKKMKSITRIHLHNHGNFPNMDPFFKESNILPVGMGYHTVDLIVWLILELGGNPDHLTFLSSVVRNWEENPQSVVGFDALFYYNGKEMRFPVALSCSHLAPPDSVDELLIVSGVGPTDNGDRLAEREVQYRRKESPRTKNPGIGESIIWDPILKQIGAKLLNQEEDEADRGAPLRHMVEKMNMGKVTEISSTGKDALPVLRALDQIALEGINV